MINAGSTNKIKLIVILLTFWSIQECESGECDGASGTEISNQLNRLEQKLTRIQDLLKDKTTQPTTPGEFWHGNQSTFGSFKRLSSDAKRNITRFKLENTADLEIDTLLQELRPCSNLESIKLNQVELLGTFPKTSAGKLVLPKLHEFELILSNNPNVQVKQVLSDVIFFQKEAKSVDEFKIENIFELQSNIKISFAGFTQFSLDHNFGELLLHLSDWNLAILPSVEPKMFKLKRLAVYGMSLNSSDVPLDLSYLNLKYIRLDGKEVDPTTEFNELVKNRRRLKSIHMDATFDSSFSAVINLDNLPPYLEHLSLRHFRVNGTGRSFSQDLKTILLDGCLIDPRVFDNLYSLLRKINRIAVLFNWNPISDTECHPFLYDLVTKEEALPKLESVLIDKCSRYFSDSAESKPKRYDEVEEFLTNLGLGKSASFYLERIMGNSNKRVWSGRNATASDLKLVKYELSDWKYLLSWENYARN